MAFRTTNRRVFFGRRHGKTLRASQKQLLATLLPTLVPAGVAADENPDRTRIDPAAWFDGARALWLEVGFGGGEHMVRQAAAHPDVGVLGCEPFVNGVAMALAKIRDRDVANIRIYPGDVRDLLEVLPDGCLDRTFLLYPDPWPKARHHKRRFVSPDYLRPLFRVMKPGAELRVATDIGDYARQALIELSRAGFDWSARCAADWRIPWPDWEPTRYEAKAVKAGRRPIYLSFVRGACSPRP